MSTTVAAAHGSRRWSGDWARRERQRAVVDVLIPTSGRRTELAATLSGLAAQDDPAFRVVISDQSEDAAARDDPVIQSLLRVLTVQGRAVDYLRHVQRRGIAENRQFLLEHARADFVLFLDDDVWLEPGMLERLHDAIEELGCGLVGCAVQGLSHLDDERPEELRTFRPWDHRVQPERIRRGTEAFERWPLHNAANLVHLAAELHLPEGEWLPYHVAWIGGCTLYRTTALRDCGGFAFWSELPPSHSGEDVAAQWKVMERYGGAGILPSGAVHLETPTTIPTRDVDAFDVLFPC
ncbi:glycosyltransferase family 2 protein [Parafrigoribacterium soli]|uniref:glycosyltransferase family 2 protein n=1 Tax=Parafrigoribacterium soli TaxID=3144663 RepID=UPI0032EE0E92